MSQETAVLLRQAKAAIKAKEPGKARRLLQKAVQQDPQDYRGWLGLASLTASPQTAMEYVQRAEMLAPDHPTVQKAKQWAQKRLITTKTAQPQRAKTAVSSSPSARKPQNPTRRTDSRSGWRVGLATAAILIILFAGLTAVFIYSNQPSQLANLARSGQAAASQPQEIIVQSLDAEPTITPLPTATETAVPTQAAQPLQGKQVAPDSPPRSTWTPTPVPTNTPIPSPTPLPTFVSESNQLQGKRPFGVSANERWIDVNLTGQTLTAYEGDELVFTTLVSSGTWQHPTVVGQFRVWLRYESQTMDGSLLGYDYYLENVPYVMYFFEDYAIHGAYWHDNFGNPMSHGCVNVHPTDAEWLFEFSSMGTLVNVHY